MKSSGEDQDAVNKPTGMAAENLQRHALLSNGIDEGVWDLELQTGNVYFNKGMSRLFGYSRFEMSNLFNWRKDCLHPADKKKIITGINRFLTSAETSWSAEYGLRCKNGRYKQVLEKMVAIRNGKGKATRVLGSMHDLSGINGLKNSTDEEYLQQQQAITRAIINAEEEERKVISDELNENINQVLATVNLHIEQAKKAVPRTASLEVLGNAQQLLLLSIEHIRALSRQLTPAGMPYFGLASSVEELLKSQEKICGLKYLFRADKCSEKKRTRQKNCCCTASCSCSLPISGCMPGPGRCLCNWSARRTGSSLPFATTGWALTRPNLSMVMDSRASSDIQRPIMDHSLLKAAREKVAGSIS